MSVLRVGPDLFAITRTHDLPPRWDGRRVEWEGWRDQHDVFVCGPAARRVDLCQRCSSQKRPVTNIGVVHPLPGETFPVESTITKRTRSGREYTKTLPPVNKPAWPLVQLHVFRCQDCRHDTVWDTSADEWWDLDPTDYDDTGSDRPQ